MIKQKKRLDWHYLKIYLKPDRYLSEIVYQFEHEKNKKLWLGFFFFKIKGENTYEFLSKEDDTNSQLIMPKLAVSHCVSYFFYTSCNYSFVYKY